MARTTQSTLSTLFAAVFLLSRVASAHEHHPDAIPQGETTSNDPIDAILWTHILLQILAWGILLPIGMVLGIIKSRWHVPTQILASCIALVGHFLGHMHKGRVFNPTAHSKYAPFLEIFLIVQIALGIYLKLHLERGFQRQIRPLIVKLHGIVGKTLPVAAWVQMVFGGIAAQGFCQGDHLGQCAAHFIMGSAFIGYAIVMTIMLLVGQAWLRRTGYSQEFFDSTVIAAWGCVNTFTEHRWGTAWVRNDLQHTTMGVIWWCAGLLGVWLSRGRGREPQRNVIPAIVIFITGWAMSSHPQELMISAATHSFFGYTLMAAGVARGVEISFVLKDQPTLSEDGSNPSSFQFLPPFLLIAAGFMFMGATEEQMEMLNGAHVDHVSYILGLYNLAFLLYLFVNILIWIYAVGSQAMVVVKLDPEQNGRIRRRRSTTLVRDAQDFELDDFGSDPDEDEDDGLGEEERLLRLAQSNSSTA